jgi:hypothetical protein
VVQHADGYVAPRSGLGFVCPGELEAPPAEEADDPRRGLSMPLRYVESRGSASSKWPRDASNACACLFGRASQRLPGWCGGGDAISVTARLRFVLPFGSFVAFLRCSVELIISGSAALSATYVQWFWS